jgi:hypothetical protein
MQINDRLTHRSHAWPEGRKSPSYRGKWAADTGGSVPGSRHDPCHVKSEMLCADSGPLPNPVLDRGPPPLRVADSLAPTVVFAAPINSGLSSGTPMPGIRSCCTDVTP